MDKEKIVNRILEEGEAGYAYYYPGKGELRDEYFIAITSENIVNLMCSQNYDTGRLLLCDMYNRIYVEFLDGTPYLRGNETKGMELEMNIGLARWKSGGIGEPLMVLKKDADEILEKGRLIVLRENSSRMRGFCNESGEMLKKIMQTTEMGYAYYYPGVGGEREEYFISTTPENLSNMIMKCAGLEGRLIITDLYDNMLVKSRNGIPYRCGSEDIFWSLRKYLKPLYEGKEESGKILMTSKALAEEHIRTMNENIEHTQQSMT